MKLISGLTDSPAQVSQIPLPDGTGATWTLSYRQKQNGWFYALNYPTTGFNVNGNRLVTSPNFLRQYENEIPFGMACATLEAAEPTGQECFVDGTASIYLLSPSDILVQNYTVFAPYTIFP